jgi:hypothetical protein
MLTASRTSSAGIAGRFVGDYQGLVALPNGFGAVLAQAKPAARAGPSDVFFARVALSRRRERRYRHASRANESIASATCSTRWTRSCRAP